MKENRILRAAGAVLRRGALVAVAATAGVLLAPSAANAETFHDFSAGGSAVINGATFTTGVFQPAGTGVIQSFVRIGAANADFVQGYNTSDRSYDNQGDFVGPGTGKAQFQALDDPNYTHDLKLSDLQVVNGNYVFRLDINQNSGGTGALLSLRDVRIFQSNTASLNEFDPATNTFANTADESLRYWMDGAPDGDTRIELNFDYNNGGSGIGDMFLYVPTSFFTSQTYVYLYSEFGNEVKNANPPPYPNNDGYEEWAALQGPNDVTNPPPTVPLPSVAFAGLALLGGLGLKRKRSA